MDFRLLSEARVLSLAGTKNPLFPPRPSSTGGGALTVGSSSGPQTMQLNYTQRTTSTETSCTVPALQDQQQFFCSEAQMTGIQVKRYVLHRIRFPPTRRFHLDAKHSMWFAISCSVTM